MAAREAAEPNVSAHQGAIQEKFAAITLAEVSGVGEESYETIKLSLGSHFSGTMRCFFQQCPGELEYSVSDYHYLFRAFLRGNGCAPQWVSRAADALCRETFLSVQPVRGNILSFASDHVLKLLEANVSSATSKTDSVQRAVRSLRFCGDVTLRQHFSQDGAAQLLYNATRASTGEDVVAHTVLPCSAQPNHGGSPPTTDTEVSSAQAHLLGAHRSATQATLATLADVHRAAPHPVGVPDQHLPVPIVIPLGMMDTTTEIANSIALQRKHFTSWMHGWTWSPFRSSQYCVPKQPLLVGTHLCAVVHVSPSAIDDISARSSPIKHVYDICFVLLQWGKRQAHYKACRGSLPAASPSSPGFSELLSVSELTLHS